MSELAEAPQNTEPSAPAEPADKFETIFESAWEAAHAPPEEAEAKTETERPRDERGRFASTPADKPSTEPAPSANPATTTTAEPAQQPLEPHPRWSEAEKATFATQPREVQQWMLERQKATEADYTRKSQELADQRRNVEPLLSAVGQWSQYLDQLGTTPDKAFNELIQFEHTLRTADPQQKAQAFAYLAQLYGVQLPTAGDGQQADPYYATLASQNTSLSQRLLSIEQAIKVSERNRAEAEFNALALTKDDSGQPKFPHFERVRQPMLQLVINGQADTWEQAYSRAIRLDDELFKETVEAERKRERDALEKARQEAVDKAKKAGPISRSNAAPNGAVERKGVDAHIEAAMARHGYA